MRPRKLRTLLSLAGVGAITAGTMLGAGVARADGVLSSTERAYVIAYNSAVCGTLDSYPSYDGVMGIAAVIHGDGFDFDDVADIINASVAGHCDRHWPLLVAIGQAAKNANSKAGYKI